MKTKSDFIRSKPLKSAVDKIEADGHAYPDADAAKQAGVMTPAVIKERTDQDVGPVVHHRTGVRRVYVHGSQRQDVSPRVRY